MLNRTCSMLSKMYMCSLTMIVFSKELLIFPEKSGVDGNISCTQIMILTNAATEFLEWGNP